MEETDADRRAEVISFPFCQAAIRADGKHCDVVAVLVLSQQVAACAIQRKVAGRFAAAGLALDPGKAAVLQNMVGRDAVMAAIGGIQELAVRRDMQVRADVLPREAIGQRGGLLTQSHFARIVTIVHYAGTNLVDKVEGLAVRGKLTVARAAATFDRDRCHLISMYFCTLVAVDHDLMRM